MINGLRQCVALLTLCPLSLSRTSPSLCNYAPFITRWRHCCVRFLFIIIIPLDCNPHDVTTTLRVPLSRYPLPCTKHSPLCVPCRRRSGKCVKNVSQHFSVIQTLPLPLLSCFLASAASWWRQHEGQGPSRSWVGLSRLKLPLHSVLFRCIWTIY